MNWLKRLFGKAEDAKPNDRRNRDTPLPFTGSNTVIIPTGAASIVLYDPEVLHHRVEDVPGWETIQRFRQEEVAARNLLYIELGGDGIYEVALENGEADPDKALSLRCQSGVFQLSAAERLPSEGTEYEQLDHGVFLAVEQGDYAASVRRDGMHISITLQKADPFENEGSTRILRLPEDG